MLKGKQKDLYQTVLDDLNDIEEIQGIDQHDDYALMEEFDLKGERWFKSLPNNIKTPRLCLYAIMHEAELLRFVPSKFKTYSLCLFAISGDWRALKYVPSNNLCDTIISEAINQSPYALSMIPRANRSIGLYNLVAKQHPHAIKFMPKDELVDQNYELAICSDPNMFFHTPNKGRNNKWKFLADSAHFLHQEEIS